MGVFRISRMRRATRATMANAKAKAKKAKAKAKIFASPPSPPPPAATEPEAEATELMGFKEIRERYREIMRAIYINQHKLHRINTQRKNWLFWYVTGWFVEKHETVVNALGILYDQRDQVAKAGMVAQEVYLRTKEGQEEYRDNERYEPDVDSVYPADRVDPITDTFPFARLPCS